MINLLLRQVRLVRYLILSIIAFGSLIYTSHAQVVNHESDSIKSIEGFFYTEIGDIENKKFYRARLFTRTGDGFYLIHPANKVLTDTQYFILDKSSTFLIQKLEEIGVKYISYERPRDFYDSLLGLKIYQLDTIPYCPKRKSKVSVVFLKIKARIFYNDSYELVPFINEKYFFLNPKQLCNASDSRIFYKPIIRIEMLE